MGKSPHHPCERSLSAHQSDQSDDPREPSAKSPHHPCKRSLSDHQSDQSDDQPAQRLPTAQSALLHSNRADHAAKAQTSAMARLSTSLPLNLHIIARPMSAKPTASELQPPGEAAAEFPLCRPATARQAAAFLKSTAGLPLRKPITKTISVLPALALRADLVAAPEDCCESQTRTTRPSIPHNRRPQCLSSSLCSRSNLSRDQQSSKSAHLQQASSAGSTTENPPPPPHHLWVASKTPLPPYQPVGMVPTKDTQCRSTTLPNLRANG